MTGCRILVTGAMSSLGQAIGKAVRLHGHSAVGTIRRDPTGIDLSMFDHIRRVDLTKPEDIYSLNDEFESVIHAAALSVGTPSDLMTSVALSTAWLLDRSMKARANSFIHVSSMSVYGDISEGIVSSSTPIRHTLPYGAAKWAAECFLHHHQADIPAVSVRSPAIVGRRSHRNFLAVLLTSLLEQRPLVRVSNPDFQFNNVIHEDVMADFLVHLATTTHVGFVAVPVGSSEPLLLSEVVEMMVKATRFKGHIEWVESPSRPFSISLDDARLLGFEPLTTDETIQMWLDGL